MRSFPKLIQKNLDAIYEWCRAIESQRSADVREAAMFMEGITPVRKLAVNITPVGNVGAGEDDLMSYVIPDGLLAKDGHYLVIEAAFTTAANGNNKRLKAKLGSTTLYDSTAIALNDKSIVIRAVVTRTGAAAEACHVTMQSNDATLGNSALYTGATESLGAAVTFKFTGEATANDDIVQKTITVRWFPAGVENA